MFANRKINNIGNGNYKWNIFLSCTVRKRWRKTRHCRWVHAISLRKTYSAITEIIKMFINLVWIVLLMAVCGRESECDALHSIDLYLHKWRLIASALTGKWFSHQLAKFDIERRLRLEGDDERNYDRSSDDYLYAGPNGSGKRKPKGKLYFHTRTANCW